MLKSLIKRLSAWLVRLSHAVDRLAPQRAGLTREVTIAGLRITAHEITVAEIYNWLRDLRKATEFDSIDALLFAEQEVSLSDLVLMSNASRATLQSIPPSELLLLVEKVKEANPFFFQLRRRWIALENQASL